MKTKMFPDIVNYRFKELMRRDSLVTDFLKKYQQYTIQHPEVLRQRGIPVMPEQLSSQTQEIREKWNIACFTYGPDGDFQVQKILEKVSEHTPVISISDVIIPDAIKDRGCDVFPKQSDHIYLDMDLSTMDMNDAKEIKKQTWELIRTKIEEKQAVTKRNRKRPQSQPKDDPPELGFIYHIKEDIFENYLRWYDFHLQEKLSFRLIARYEQSKIANSAKAKDFLQECINKAKRPTIGETRWEDRVGKGVHCLYRAIYRAGYDQKKVGPITEQYACPEHRNNCPSSCKYLKAFMERFNRSIPAELFVQSIDEGAVDVIALKRAGKLPLTAKAKVQKQKNYE